MAARFVNLAVSLPQDQFASHTDGGDCGLCTIRHLIQPERHLPPKLDVRAYTTQTTYLSNGISTIES
jgi:hypothetical protein